LRLLLCIVLASILLGCYQDASEPHRQREEGTPVKGTIGTVTWRRTKSPYRIAGDLVVPPGHVLTIEPGVDVVFDTAVVFRVEGSLRALGTAQDSVRILNGPGNLRLLGTLWFSNGDSSALRYARISDIGGVYVSGFGTRLDMANSVISACYGGGLHADSARVRLEACTIRGNGGVPSGGGINLRSCDAELIGCAISENSADVAGGGIYVERGSIVMTDCLVERNAVAPTGSVGALYVKNAAAILRNCLIAGNRSPRPPGNKAMASDVYFTGAADLVNCTIATNGSPGRDLPRRAAYVGGAGLVLHMTNSIIWGNQPPGIALNPRATATITYSIIQGDTTWAGKGNLNTDPLYVSVANGDYRLRTGSPGIDAGDPSSPRDPDGTRADIGWRSPVPVELPPVEAARRPTARRN